MFLSHSEYGESDQSNPIEETRQVIHLFCVNVCLLSMSALKMNILQCVVQHKPGRLQSNSIGPFKAIFLCWPTRNDPLLYVNVKLSNQKGHDGWPMLHVYKVYFTPR